MALNSDFRGAVGLLPSEMPLPGSADSGFIPPARGVSMLTGAGTNWLCWSGRPDAVVSPVVFAGTGSGVTAGDGAGAGDGVGAGPGDGAGAGTGAGAGDGMG